MPLVIPPGTSFGNLIGGYNSNLNYTNLQDNQTNDALNVQITDKGSIKERGGYQRRLNTRLVNVSSSDDYSAGLPIMGHFQLVKLGNSGTTVKAEIVAAGESLYDYTSTSATSLGAVTDNSSARWQFAQIQDPRNASDDIVVMTNGVDPITFWNGTDVGYSGEMTSATDAAVEASAITSFFTTAALGLQGRVCRITDTAAHTTSITINDNDSSTFTLDVSSTAVQSGSTYVIEALCHLSAITSATGVPICKYIASMQNRLYALNIVDADDVDSNVKVMVSEFATDTGAPRPQRFTTSFYVGGSDKYGEITGHAVLNDQLVIFKRNATYKFIPGGGRLVDTAGLMQMDESVGCIAPYSVATVGNLAIFLSEIGVMAFDGGNFLKISDPLNEDFQNLNREQMKYAVGVFNKERNQYWLSMATQGQTDNDITFVYDIDRKVWFPPYKGFAPTYWSQYRDNGDNIKLTFGDNYGYVYTADEGTADGYSVGYSATICSATTNVYRISGAAFYTAGDGLAGSVIRHVTGDPINDTFRTIVANDSETITLDDAFDFTPNSASDAFIIGGINSYYRSKDYGFGSPDTDKKFRRVVVRAGQLGDVDCFLNYNIDFKGSYRGGTASFDLVGDGLTWDLDAWDAAYWDGAENIMRKITLRPNNAQGLIGKFLSLRFYNQASNQPWEIYGFDIQWRHVGRRNK